jgi:transposase
MNDPQMTRYPRLEAILSMKNLPLKPMYSNRDVAEIFGVTIKTIQNYVAAGKLHPRDLPGRAKYLAQDLEDYIESSLKKAA